MAKTLILPLVALGTPSLEALKKALNGLDQNGVPLWGSMNPAQMLLHCSQFMDLYLGRVQLPIWVRWVSRAMGPRFLRSFLVKPLGSTPRNMGTLPALRMGPGLHVDFEEGRRRFLEGLSEVESLEGVVLHPMYGPMKAEDAQALVRHHTAHHFCQFGLI